VDHATQVPLLVAGGGGGGTGGSSPGTGGDGGPVPQPGEDGGAGTGGDGGCAACQGSGWLNGGNGEGSSFTSGGGSSYVAPSAGAATQATSQLARNGLVTLSWNGSFLDADADGVPDAHDRFRGSDLSPTVVLGRCDTRAGNDLDVDNCTHTDRVAAIAAGTKSRDAFVRRIARLWHDLNEHQFFTPAERKAIRRCAAKVGLARLGG
jgi:hypothetical protein